MKTVDYRFMDEASADESADSMAWRLVRVGVVLGAMVLFVLWALL